MATLRNKGVSGLRRIVDGRAEFLLATLWDSRDAAGGIAASNLDRTER